MASLYWDMVGFLLKGVINNFPGRIHQGASDLANNLLNYGYTLLRSRVLLERHRSGLNPYVGFLNSARKGMATLTFDFMEAFRPQVVDRVVLAELRRHSQHLKLDKEGILTLENRQRLIKQVNVRLDIERFRGRKLKLEEIIREQVKDLRGHIEINYHRQRRWLDKGYLEGTLAKT